MWGIQSTRAVQDSEKADPIILYYTVTRKSWVPEAIWTMNYENDAMPALLGRIETKYWMSFCRQPFRVIKINFDNFSEDQFKEEDVLNII